MHVAPVLKMFLALKLKMKTFMTKVLPWSLPRSDSVPLWKDLHTTKIPRALPENVQPSRSGRRSVSRLKSTPDPSISVVECSANEPTTENNTRYINPYKRGDSNGCCMSSNCHLEKWCCTGLRKEKEAAKNPRWHGNGSSRENSILWNSHGARQKRPLRTEPLGGSEYRPNTPSGA